jgi:hypothetical protein
MNIQLYVCLQSKMRLFSVTLMKTAQFSNYFGRTHIDLGVDGRIILEWI